MKKHFLKDYLLFATAKALGWFFRALPVGFALYLGKVIGTFGYYLDKKHKNVIYTNIKIAFGQSKSFNEIKKITKKSFQNFCQHVVEVLCLPKISYGYTEKYVKFENKDVILDPINKKQAMILSSMHFGSWELSFVLCDKLGPPFRIVAREHEKYVLTDRLLSSYRQMRPGSVLYRGDNPREMIRIIKNKELLGLVLDQGGREGQLTKFFGKNASFPTGALRLALKFDVPVVVSFIIRLRGPFHKIILKKLDLKKTGDIERDIDTNLKKVTRLGEEMIRQYPDQYMWLYKIWKYTDERKIVILNDGKIGHLRQSQAVTKILVKELGQRNLKSQVEILDVKFKNRFSKALLAVCSLPAAKRHCQGCLWCLEKFLDKSSFRKLSTIKSDFIVSCGSALSNINYILSNDSRAKSISILKPNLLATNRFDLVIMPKHDRPAQRKNVVITNGSLNLVDEDYLKDQSQRLIAEVPVLGEDQKTRIGVFIGGDTKGYQISYDAIRDLISELKEISKQLNLQVLLTTSRRTPLKVEELIRREFKEFSRCKLLIIANDDNIPEAVGGIMGLSEIIIVSNDSISMVSEAASSGKYVIVVETAQKTISQQHKHRIFLRHLSEQGYISLINPENISKSIKETLIKKPKIKKIDDNQIVTNAIRKIV
ncbi:MAG: ELM1/GtrOC1 family putative glycosyltransferase [Candidatus Omnitrophota bacterium]